MNNLTHKPQPCLDLGVASCRARAFERSVERSVGAVMAVLPVVLPARCWLCGVVPLAMNLLPWMLVTRRSVMLSIFRTCEYRSRFG